MSVPKPSEELNSKTKPTDQPSTITLRISRSNPSEGQEASFSEFQIPVQKWTTVLEAILYVKQNFDHSVAVRYSCRQASCGSCGMKINGKPALACYTKISELNSNVVTVEPMNNFPIIRDLAVDFKQLISNHKKMKPFIIREDSEITPGSKEFIQKPEDLEKLFTKFYKGESNTSGS